MLALAEPPTTQSDLIPGLKRSPEWHREEEAREQAWLNAYARWAVKYGDIPVRN